MRILKGARSHLDSGTIDASGWQHPAVEAKIGRTAWTVGAEYGGDTNGRSCVSSARNDHGVATNR
jgi:hypothetical protein